MNDKLMRRLDDVTTADGFGTVRLNRKLFWGVLAGLFVIITLIVAGWAMYFVQKGETGDARNQIQQLQTEAAGLKQRIKELETEVAKRGPRVNINGIRVIKIETGWWHAADFLNESDMDLHEVKVTITAVGGHGEQKFETRYFPIWGAGRTQRVELSNANSPADLQKISMDGWCDEGNIAVSGTR
jgi:hypothetical protein